MSEQHRHASCGHRCPCAVPSGALCAVCLWRVTNLPLDEVMELRVVGPTVRLFRDLRTSRSPGNPKTSDLSR